MNQQTNIATIGPSLVARMGERYGVDAAKLLDTLKATAFKVKDSNITNEQLLSLLVVADQFGLNPFTREIFAFPDKGGIVPVVGVDGWARITNQHPMFDGMSFSMPEDGSSCTCTMHRKDRAFPTEVTEYMVECKRATAPWASHPRRMLRHKTMIQTARLAFGFAGIYDPDEAERIANAESAPSHPSGMHAVKAAVKKVASIAMVERVDPTTGEIAPDATPITYAVFADRLVKTKDAELAGLILDEARELPADQYEDLRAIYARQFKPEA